MRQPLIVIIDYEVGNTFSVQNALRNLSYKNVLVSRDFEHIDKADYLILPGVGAFNKCAENLRRFELEPILNKNVLEKKKPILGICVGMQLMSNYSYENGFHEGLGWIPGHVEKVQPVESLFRVPHVGWNEVFFEKNYLKFRKENYVSDFYFDHSYHFICHKKYIAGKCNYSMEISSFVNKENIYGVQFHPEKSSYNGLRFFRAFLSI